MANIYNFPAGVQAREPATLGDEPPQGARGNLRRPEGVPQVVWDAVCSVHDMARVPGVLYREIPVSRRLCDFGIGVELTLEVESETGVLSGAGTLASSTPAPYGWLHIMYSNRWQDDWDSHWRCAAFLRSPITGSEDDELTPAMYWDETMAHITSLVPGSLRATVSMTRDTAFSGASDSNINYRHVGCEMRMAWTPAPHARTGDDTGIRVDNSGGGDAHGHGVGIDAGGQIACLANLLVSTAKGDEDAHAGQ